MHSKNNGVTLIEILVAISIFIMVSILIWLFVTNSYKTHNFSFEQSTSITEARRGIETMVKELREAMPADDGAYPIAVANDFELIFYADFDRDSSVEKIHYWLDGSDFKKGITEPNGLPVIYDDTTKQVEVISRYVRNNSSTPLFSYYDGDYNNLSTPADVDTVKLIRTYLKINVFEQRAPLNYDLESDVTLRNLKDNL